MDKFKPCGSASQEKLTPLYEQHLALGAQMSSINGWVLPSHFGSQVDEHQQVRKDCGVFDISFMRIIDISGTEVEPFLEHLLANDIRSLEDSSSVLRSALLNEQGGVIDVVLVYRLDSGYRLVCTNNLKGKTLEWITGQQKDFAVDLSLRDDLALISVQGPNAINRLVELLNVPMSTELGKLSAQSYCTHEDWLFTRTGYTGEDGIDIMLPVLAVEAFWLELLGYGIMPIGMNARDTLRLEAGFNRYGQEMDESVSPLACNMNDLIDIKNQHRIFIGRAALTDLIQQGCKDRLVGIVSEERSILHNGQQVRVEDIGEGIICSTNFSPTIGKYIALARVPSNTGARAEVEIKGKWYPVRVVSPRFVWKGDILV